MALAPRLRPGFAHTTSPAPSSSLFPPSLCPPSMPPIPSPSFRHPSGGTAADGPRLLNFLTLRVFPESLETACAGVCCLEKFAFHERDPTYPMFQSSLEIGVGWGRGRGGEGRIFQIQGRPSFRPTTDFADPETRARTVAPEPTSDKKPLFTPG